VGFSGGVGNGLMGGLCLFGWLVSGLGWGSGL